MSIQEMLKGKYLPQPEMEIPVTWPGQTDVKSLVSVLTMAANALGDGNLSIDAVNRYFSNDEYGLVMLPNILDHMAARGKIGPLKYETKAIRVNGLLPENPRQIILGELTNGNLILAMLSYNQWENIFAGHKREERDYHLAVLINGYSRKNHEIGLKVIHPTYGPQVVPYKEFEKTFEVISANDAANFWFPHLYFGFIVIGVFKKANSPMPKQSTS